MLDSPNGSPCPAARLTFITGPDTDGTRCEGNMRKATVSFSAAGLLVSLSVASCVVKQEDSSSGNGGTPGSGGATTPSVGKGGATTTVTGKGGATAAPAGTGGSTFIPSGVGGVGGGGGSTEPACPGLLEKFQTKPEDVCSSAEVAAQYSKINMLIVLDKSGSMNSVATGETKTKWAGATDAITAALDPNETLVSYGFMMYPYAAPVAATNCELDDGAAAVNIPVGPAVSAVPAIVDLMKKTAPGGGTPTAAALASAYDYYLRGAGMGLDGPKYVLLVTDGGPNCNAANVCTADTCTANMDKSGQCGVTVPNCCDPSLKIDGKVDPATLCLDDTAVTAQLEGLRSAGINTFVIGIPGTEAYANYLDGFATAGGVPVAPSATQTRKYYEVKTSADLTAAFKTITTSLVRDCSIQLAKPPLDLSLVNVAVDCAQLPQQTAGVPNWEYKADTNSILIEGTKCDVIKTVGVKRIDVVSGCPTIIQG
jgi:hypothetical protein